MVSESRVDSAAGGDGQVTDEPTLEEQLAASYAQYKAAGEPGVPWEQVRAEARLVRAEAERDAALAVLRQLVDKCAEIRRLELLEYGTDEYDEGLQAAIGSAYRRRNEAEDAARRLLSARR